MSFCMMAVPRQPLRGWSSTAYEFVNPSRPKSLDNSLTFWVEACFMSANWHGSSDPEWN